jgi:HAD superfamily hydrolase (TIGR01509 family)
LVGNALETSAEYIRDVGGVPLEPSEIIERLQKEVVAEAERVMPWRPGALELIGALRTGGVPCAMVTMSYSELAATVAAQLPRGTFATVVTGDEVADGKPHPEAYLTAAARLGVQATRCVAIEDSPTGIASATAAGCVVVGIPHHVAVQADANVRIVDSLTELSVERLNEFVRQP